MIDFRLPAAFAAALVMVPAAHAGTLSLTGSDARGYLALSRINTETVQPNTGAPGSKPFQYPVYFDPNLGSGLWDTIVAEKLSSASSYPQESSFTVVNKTVTDADFAQFSIGSLSWSDALVGPAGTTVLAPGQFTLTLSAADFSPKPKPRNAAPTFNEFNWTYVLTPSDLAGTGLTFVDGVLRSADFVADIEVDVLFNGSASLAWNPGFFQADALRFAGNRFAFGMDVAVNQSTPLGPLDTPRLVFNREGTLDGIAPIPEPSTYALLAAGLLGLLGVARRRAR